MDQVRRVEYTQVATKDRAFTMASATRCRRSLRNLLRANQPLATAYLLKEEFG
jgi:hypothetical protein